MKHTKIITVIATLIINNAAWAQSTGHIGHGGSGSSDDACIKARASRFNPEHLASVAPGAEFSFAASGSNGPGHIHVSIKQKPINITVEDKETFYLVKGKLPEDIKNTVVRISIDLKAKSPKCNEVTGWLLKVGE